MSILSGPELEDVVKQAVLWYAQARIDLIQKMEEDRPYGKKKLTQMEQMIQFESMQPQGWTTIMASLYDRYRGLPDVDKRVNDDLAAYVARMFTLRQQAGPIQPDNPLGGV